MHAGRRTVANAGIYDGSEAVTSYNPKKRVKSSSKKKLGNQKRNRLASAHQLGDQVHGIQPLATNNSTI